MMRAGQDAAARGVGTASPLAQLQQNSTSNQPQETPVVTRIADILEQHNTGLATLCKRLGSVADRVLGSVPGDAGESGATPPQHCTTARVDAGLGDYADGLRWLSSLVERLERL